MDYIIPDYLKEEIVHGKLAEVIDTQLANYNIPSNPRLYFVGPEDFSKRFKAFICYKYLRLKGKNERLLFIETLRFRSPDIFIDPLIEQFVNITILSKLSSSQVDSYVNDISYKYFSMIRNCQSRQYELFCEKLKNDKKFAEKFYKDVNDYSSMCDIPIDINLLRLLTICAIIESKRNQKFDTEFYSIAEASEYGYTLYTEQLLTLEERKAIVDRDKEIMKVIDILLDNNDLSRS